MAVEFHEVDLGEVHPNTAVFELSGTGGRSMLVRGSSLGGGDVVVRAIDGFEVEANGDLPLLIVEHTDQPGEIAAVTGILAQSGTNIAEMRVSRERRGARALMLIETDVEVEPQAALAVSELSGVTGVRQVPAV
jgi:L-serine dehydratase